jgi:hypothetical protein
MSVSEWLSEFKDWYLVYLLRYRGVRRYVGRSIRGSARTLDTIEKIYIQRGIAIEDIETWTFPSIREAWDKECFLYHKYRTKLWNRIHPAVPAGSGSMRT